MDDHAAISPPDTRPDRATGTFVFPDAMLRPIASLDGISRREAALLPKLVGGGSVLDLVFHLPTGFVDRSAAPALAEAEPGTIVTVAVTVVRVVPPGNERQPWRVAASDGTAEMDLVLFRPVRLRQLPVGARVVVSGRIDTYGRRLRMAHPDLVVPEEARGEIPSVSPIWRLTSGLGQGSVQRAMTAALARLPDAVAEWHDAALARREDWPDFVAALRTVQAPDRLDARRDGRARARLAYDETLALQLGIGLLRARARTRPGRAMTGDEQLRAEALRRFGHRPTPSQTQALAEIDADLAASHRMLRLLQGDVGSGKTLVAILAMLRAVEAGAQAALMAPTEVLANQHHATLSRLSAVPVALVTGSTKGRARRASLAGIADGSVPLAVGTHALFGPDVAFRDLGLAVIDEQHRFGVGQRLLLGAKGDRTDVLVMSATPIPRSLLLARWGEMSVSRITGKPAGRQPIRTTTHPMQRLAAVIDAVGRAIEAGALVFWVCPLVAESETVDVAAAEGRFAALAARFGTAAVGLAHGQQDPVVRDAALAAFAAGETRVLVATTVIEVGVDVPAASVMVVEGAERFGLAQLHQLRGRVGRGAARSYCLLLHDDAPTETARARLATIRRTEDGFLIADEDFRLRGAGDALGSRQSGMPGARLAIGGIEQDRLLRIARRDTDAVLARDPALADARGLAIRTLLRLFGQDEGERLLEAG